MNQMPKINQEEYELLKSLGDNWKWIARDEDLSVYDDKPVKVHSVIPCWDISTSKNEWQRVNRSLFQFIQWSDSEPYNIAELIREYERYEIGNIHIGRKHPMFNCDRLNGFYNANIAIWDRLEESEETEVKKDIEWLKEEIGELPCVDTVFNNGGSSYIDSTVPVMAVYDLLDQLDNQEVLSQEWIDKNKFEVNGWDEAVHVEYLQNLLMPKQEEVNRAYKDGYEKGKEHTFYKGYLEGLADKESINPERSPEVDQHKELLDELNDLYARKNQDYGNSFDESLDEDGLLVLKIRLGDKYKRFSQLINQKNEVVDESMRDTLIDLANYALMGVMWMDSQEEEE